MREKPSIKFNTSFTGKGERGLFCYASVVNVVVKEGEPLLNNTDVCRSVPESLDAAFACMKKGLVLVGNQAVK